MPPKEKQQIHGYKLEIEGEVVAGGAERSAIRELRNTLTDMYIVAVEFKTTPTDGTNTDHILCESGEPIFGATFDEGTARGVICTSFNQGHNQVTGVSRGPLRDRIDFPSGIYYYLEKGERIYFHMKARNTHPTTGYTLGSVCFIYYTTENPY